MLLIAFDTGFEDGFTLTIGPPESGLVSARSRRCGVRRFKAATSCATVRLNQDALSVRLDMANAAPVALSRAKCPRCGFVVTATTRAANVEAQREHTRQAHPDAPELHQSPPPPEPGVG